MGEHKQTKKAPRHLRTIKWLYCYGMVILDLKILDAFRYKPLSGNKNITDLYIQFCTFSNSEYVCGDRSHSKYLYAILI